MKLAIVTPLPPQKTGIADYAADLIAGFRSTRFEIDLFSNVEIEKFHHFRVFNIEKIEPSVLNKYDLIIYQMGNNIHFHLYMLELIKRYRGIVHLHDMVLHHTFAWITWGQNRTKNYFEIIEKWYGTEVKNLVNKMVSLNKMPWDSEVVTEIPLFEELIQYADACIVHSEFVKEKIKTVFPELNVYKIDQLYKIDVQQKKNSNHDVVKFGVFGGVDPQKRVDWTLKVFGEIKNKYNFNNFHLTIVGDIDERCKYMLKLPKKYHIDDMVEFMGRVSEDDFVNYFSNTDVLIALRYPTMGETSAVVMKAMQMGIPSIVNDIGWYHELPPYVKKIAVSTVEEDLKSTIIELLENNQSLIDFINSAISFSERSFDFDKYVDRYSLIVNHFYKEKLNTILYRQIAPVVKGLSYTNDSVIYTPIITKLIDIF